MSNEPFVNDVRANDDESLNLIPRINNFAELKQHFGLDVDRSLGEAATNPGERYWRLVGFEVRTGVAAFLTQVKAANGGPADKIVVFSHWPTAPDTLPSSVIPQYFNNADGGFTNADGVIGSPYFGDAVTGPDGGVYVIWCSADPPGGVRVASDAAIRLGWIGGTDHLTANPIFQDVVKDANGNPPPSTGVSELRVFDGFGQFLGKVVLTKGVGTGKRIALFENGVEAGYTLLVD